MKISMAEIAMIICTCAAMVAMYFVLKDGTGLDALEANELRLMVFIPIAAIVLYHIMAHIRATKKDETAEETEGEKDESDNIRN